MFLAIGAADGERGRVEQAGDDEGRSSGIAGRRGGAFLCGIFPTYDLAPQVLAIGNGGAPNQRMAMQPGRGTAPEVGKAESASQLPMHMLADPVCLRGRYPPLVRGARRGIAEILFGLPSERHSLISETPRLANGRGER